jgi:hypothetical protein
MARRKDALTAELFGDLSTMSPNEVLAAASQRQERLFGSLRSDYAGTPSNLLAYPSTYQQRVMKVWEGYNTDPFFKRMLDRAVEFAANGHQWEVPTEPDGKSWLTKIKQWVGGGGSREDQEEDFWQAWSQQLNKSVANTVAGLETHAALWDVHPALAPRRHEVRQA